MESNTGFNIFLKISPHTSSYLEAVLTTPEDSDPVIPWDFGGQKSIYWIGAFLKHSLSQRLKNPSCQKLSEEIILQLLRMKALLYLFGVVHFKKVRSLSYNQTTLYFTFIQHQYITNENINSESTLFKDWLYN